MQGRLGAPRRRAVPDRGDGDARVRPGHRRQPAHPKVPDREGDTQLPPRDYSYMMFAEGGGGDTPKADDTVVLISCASVRAGNRGVRVSVFGCKCCVFLAVCGQILQKVLRALRPRLS